MPSPTLNVSNGIATITFQRPSSYNAITSEDYDFFASALREVDKRNDVLVTVWQATGKFFCAGTDVKRSNVDSTQANNTTTVRQAYVDTIVRTATDCSQALYSHNKILVAALNGPVIGIAAAFLGYFDFIYSVPDAWLSMPFTFLGIVAEAGASVTFANRMGVASANEILIWGKKKDASELKQIGFINDIFDCETTEEFHREVREHLLYELDGLDPVALLAVKRLLRQGMYEKNNPDSANLRESYAQAERFASGIPNTRFKKLANKEIRHKL